MIHNEQPRRPGTNPRRSHYPKSFKVKIAALVEQMSVEEICRRHGISKTSVYSWARKFKKEVNHTDPAPTFVKLNSPQKTVDDPSPPKHHIEFEIAAAHGALVRIKLPWREQLEDRLLQSLVVKGGQL